MFSALLKTNFNCSVTFILSSANAFSLNHSKILSFGKELTVFILSTAGAFNLPKIILSWKSPKFSCWINSQLYTSKQQNVVLDLRSPIAQSVALRTGGCWFDPRLSQYSFQGLMIVIATGFISLSLLSIVSTMVIWESSQWLGKNIVQSTG